MAASGGSDGGDGERYVCGDMGFWLGRERRGGGGGLRVGLQEEQEERETGLGVLHLLGGRQRLWCVGGGGGGVLSMGP